MTLLVKLCPLIVQYRHGVIREACGSVDAQGYNQWEKGTHKFMASKDEQLATEIERIKKGGAEKYHIRNREQKKLFARDRLKLLLDDGKIEFEDGMFAECQNPELPSDGNITGVGRIYGRPVAFSASDSTVKAGSAGGKSAPKNPRTQEMARAVRIPLFSPIDSSAGRLTHPVRR